jgi:signal transduction histidine kinase
VGALPAQIEIRGGLPGVGVMTPADLAELIGAFNDVTSRLSATHEQLQQEVSRLRAELSDANAELERSRRLAALGEMAAGIAHEVRNPLGGIRLYARLLEQDLEDRPEQLGIVRKLSGAARGLDQIVTDMLTFAREFRLSSGPGLASDLIEQSVAACQHDGVPGRDRVTLVRAYAEGPAVELVADQGLAVQALTNVVRNAYEAMADDKAPSGRLVIDARATIGEDGRPEAVISIEDSGPGVSDETIARMFNPFFTTRATGTGLGLAIVHRIMDAHGGRVRVRNNTRGADGPRGATVELVFPGVRVDV